MAEKVKQEMDKGAVDGKRLLLGFYEAGDDIEIVSNVDPWVEGDFSTVLSRRSSEALAYLSETLLRKEYMRLKNESDTN